MNFYISHFSITDAGARFFCKEVKVSFRLQRPVKVAWLSFLQEVKIHLMKSLICRGRLATHQCPRPESHEAIAAASDHMHRHMASASMFLYGVPGCLVSFCASSSPRHLEAEGMIWLSTFPFSDPCTEQSVPLALVSSPHRPGISQLEAQVETLI